MNLTFHNTDPDYKSNSITNLGVEPRDYPITYDTNPSEDGSCCNLGSINVTKFYNEENNEFDLYNFSKQVKRASYYLDLMIDASEYPLEGIKKNAFATRPIGLGLMGIHDLGIMMNMPFNTTDHNSPFYKLCDSIAIHYGSNTLMATVEMVEDLGKKPFDEVQCVKDLFNEFFKNTNDNDVTEIFKDLIEQDNKVIPPSIKNTLLYIYDINSYAFKRIINALRNGRIRNSRRNSIAPTGCQVKDTYVNLIGGLYRLDEIGDINSNKIWNENLISYSRGVEQENTNTNISRFYINGYCNTKKITLSSGLELECTYNHKYRILDKNNDYVWKRADELESGDRIVYKVGSYYNHININEYEFDSRCKEELGCSIDELINELNKNPEKGLPIRLRTNYTNFIEVFFNKLFFDNKYCTISKRLAQELLIFLRFTGKDGYIKKNDTCYEIIKLDANGLAERKNELINSVDLFYDTVVTIENSTNYTYDIEVPENHTYIANSYISHNTISMLCDTSSGVEPNFSYAYERKVTQSDGNGGTKVETLQYIHPLIPDKYKAELLENGTIADPVYKNAREISTADHMGIVSIFAKITDCSISKTINMPNEITVREIEEAYINCYLQGIKGITIYRDGSRSGQPISDIKTKKSEENNNQLTDEEANKLFDILRANNFTDEDILAISNYTYKPCDHKCEHHDRVRRCPDKGSGEFMKIKTSYGKVYVMAKFNDNDEMCEVFVTQNKSGQELKAVTEALSRLISIALQEADNYAIVFKRLIKTLNGISGFEYFVYDGERTGEEYIVRSIPDLLSYVLPDLEYMHLLNKYHDENIAINKMIAPLNVKYKDTVNNNKNDDEDMLTSLANVVKDEVKNNNDTVNRYNKHKDFICPECGGSQFYYSEGCARCTNCGASKCAIA